MSLLSARGINTYDQIRRFFFPSFKDLTDPYLMDGIRRAEELIHSHGVQGHRIMIHGDYDADGVTASAILFRTFQKLGFDTFVFIPHRMRDGYGFSERGVSVAIKREASLIVTVDCGISCIETIDGAKSRGLDVIVVDHHRLSPNGLPPADVIVHPEVGEVQESFFQLCAAGLAYKIGQALLGDASRSLLDLAALGTVADMAPLRGENRALVKLGLGKIEERNSVGIEALLENAKTPAKVRSRDLAYSICPRINAAGRLDSALSALDLLVCEDSTKVRGLADLLESANNRRRKIERSVCKEAFQKIDVEINFNRDRIIVVWSNNWHPGVIGIVASRIVAKYHRPAIVVSTNGDGIGKGSARSVGTFNIFGMLEKSAHLLIEFGGHSLAAGLTIKSAKLPAFRQFINEIMGAMVLPSDFIKSFDVDFEIEQFEDLSVSSIRELDLFEPFGYGNSRPIFLTRNLSLKNAPVRLGKNRLQFWVQDRSLTLEAIWNYAGPFPFDQDVPIDLIYSPGLKWIRGEEHPFLEVNDVKASRLD
uniref:Single-stranded-DNA-specific exonuclease RecJ n=1 Tax=uncultured bacterium W4-21b TaxID=1130993 RepID=H9BWN3_9BACT|nr:single-stranded-DNA-specific exonuclease RecJ [uncultured bacterium W4-21b]